MNFALLPARLMHAALLWAVACGTAMAWDSSLPLPMVSQGRFYPTAAATDDAGRLWATGYTLANPVVVRYDTAGTSSLVIRDFGTSGRTPHQWIRTAGGMAGFIDGDGCYVVKYDTDGTLRWQYSLACTTPPDYLRSWLEPNLWPAGTDGNLWVRAGHGMHHLDADGHLVKKIEDLPFSAEVDDVDPRDGRVITTAIYGANRTPLVAAYDRAGTRLWEWRGNGSILDFGNLRAGFASDGSVRVTGVDSQGLFAAAVDRNGSTIWSRNITTPALGEVKRLLVPLVDTTGATWIVLEPDNAAAPVLVVVSPTGETRLLRNRAELEQPAASTRNVTARLAPGNELMLSRRGTVSKVAADGTLRFTRALTPDATVGGTSEPLAEFADVDAQGTATFIVTPMDGQYRFERLTATGVALPAPQSEIAAPERTYAAQVGLPDGSLLAWARSARGTRELLKLQPDGTVAWRVPTPGTWSIGDNIRNGSLDAAGDRVCTLDARQAGSNVSEFVLSCYATADGSPLWSRTLQSSPLDPEQGVLPVQLSLAVDGTVSTWFGRDYTTGGFGVDYQRVDRAGTVVATKTWADAILFTGLAVNRPFAWLATAEQNIIVDRSGNERYRLPTVGTSGTIAFDDDGGGFVVAIGNAHQTQLLRRFDATGTQRWSREITPTSGSRIPVIVGGGSVFVFSCCKTDENFGQSSTLIRLALDTGAVIWARDYTNDASSSTLAFAPAGDTLVSLSNGATGSKTIVDVVDVATGNLRKRHIEACRETRGCFSVAAFIDARSRLHFVETGGTAILVGWQLPSSQARDIRLDQPGVTGAWWAPYANGEGFVLDWLPTSRTLFMPWFTFSVEGGNDPSGQRWYSVAGEVPANATSVELPIAEAVGGAFDDPQAVTRRIIGKATLSFTDCDNGTLQYAFDAPYNNAAKGVITLSRLSPATQDCVLADGSTQVRRAAPANGFDARMSGSWYEEATSGQGLQFTVQPGGIFFAPWFTFDPKGASDDPDNKRWFSIQGSLANAVNGKVELPIAQAIGGAFDRVPTNNFSVVGKATLTMQGCDRAKIDYRFDDTELAGAMRGKAGTLDLAKAGGCAP